MGNEISFKVLKKDGTTSMVCKGTVAGDRMKLSIENLSEGDYRQAFRCSQGGELRTEGLTRLMSYARSDQAGCSCSEN